MNCLFFVFVLTLSAVVNARNIFDARNNETPDNEVLENRDKLFDADAWEKLFQPIIEDEAEVPGFLTGSDIHFDSYYHKRRSPSITDKESEKQSNNFWRGFRRSVFDQY